MPSSRDCLKICMVPLSVAIRSNYEKHFWFPWPDNMPNELVQALPTLTEQHTGDDMTD